MPPVDAARTERLDRLTAERYRLQGELEELTRLALRLANSSAESRGYQAQVEAEHASLCARLAETEARHQELTDQIRRLANEVAEADRELQPLREAVHASRVRVHDVHDELEHARSVLARTEASSAELRRCIERIDAEMETLARSSAATVRPPPHAEASGMWALALEHARENMEAAERAAGASDSLARRRTSSVPPDPRAPKAVVLKTAGEIHIRNTDGALASTGSTRAGEFEIDRAPDPREEPEPGPGS